MSLRDTYSSTAGTPSTSAAGTPRPSPPHTYTPGVSLCASHPIPADGGTPSVPTAETPSTANGTSSTPHRNSTPSPSHAPIPSHGHPNKGDGDVDYWAKPTQMK